MEKSEIDRVLGQDKIIPELKGKFGEYEDGRVVPLDDEARREMIKTARESKHSSWWGYPGSGGKE